MYTRDDLLVLMIRSYKPETTMRATTKNYREVFGTREGYKLDKLTGLLVKNVGKEVNQIVAAKHVYNKKDGTPEENRKKLKFVALGINRQIKRNKLAYKPVSYSGVGAEATILLAYKTKK